MDAQHKKNNSATSFINLKRLKPTSETEGNLYQDFCAKNKNTCKTRETELCVADSNTHSKVKDHLPNSEELIYEAIDDDIVLDRYPSRLPNHTAEVITNDSTANTLDVDNQRSQGEFSLWRNSQEARKSQCLMSAGVIMTCVIVLTAAAAVWKRKSGVSGAGKNTFFAHSVSRFSMYLHIKLC